MLMRGHKDLSSLGQSAQARQVSDGPQRGTRVVRLQVCADVDSLSFKQTYVCKEWPAHGAHVCTATLHADLLKLPNSDISFTKALAERPHTFYTAAMIMYANAVHARLNGLTPARGRARVPN